MGLGRGVLFHRRHLPVAVVAAVEAAAAHRRGRRGEPLHDDIPEHYVCVYIYIYTHMLSIHVIHMYIYIYIYKYIHRCTMTFLSRSTIQETRTQRSGNKRSYWGQRVSHIYIHLSLSLSLYIYIYIYTERERYTWYTHDTYIYIYIYVSFSERNGLWVWVSFMVLGSTWRCPRRSPERTPPLGATQLDPTPPVIIFSELKSDLLNVSSY